MYGDPSDPRMEYIIMKCILRILFSEVLNPNNHIIIRITITFEL